MNLRKTLLNDWPILLIMALPFIFLGYFWDQIPEEIAMQWDFSGEVSRYGKKGIEAFFTPILAVALYFLFIYVPVIDPKKRTDNRQKALKAFRFVVPMFLSLLSIVMLYQWLGSDFSPIGVLYMGVSVMFLVFGNYMHTIKPNYFIGIRTPWTLESEENWRKTHQMGSKIWVIGSVLMMLLWFFLSEENLGYALMGGLLIMSVITVWYSFSLYMKERKNLQDSETP